MDPTEQVLAQVKNDRAREALRGWLSAHSAVLVPESWRGKGYTSAQLIGAQLLRYRANPIVVILKINSSGGGTKEFNAHLRAVADSPDFAKDHLAKLLPDHIEVPGGGSIFLQSPAGGGLDETYQLDAAVQTYQAPDELCREITTSLLEAWNAGGAVEVETTSVGATLARTLGERLSGIGTITAWAGGHPGLQDDPRPWIDTAPEPLVNPFALIGQNSWGGTSVVNVWRGKVHGDLHPGNLLADLRRGSYCLVDLSRYTPTGLLGWDQVYLSLTTIAEILPDLGPQGRRSLGSWCLEPTTTITVDGLPVHLQQLLLGVDQASCDWARERNHVSGWRNQRLICLLAIALVLTGRSTLLPPESRTWFFWLAAAAATRLAQRIPGFPPPDDAVVLRRPLFVAGAVDDDVRPSAEVVSLDQRRQERRPPANAERDPTAQAEYWTRLSAELRAAEFDAPDAAVMSARTNRLRLQLPQAPTGTGGDLARYLGDLATALATASSPGTSRTERLAACRRADLLRAWILDRLA
ncbi:hypothetical protein [Actinoplanes sp. NPDC051851]|uniref:hypothetical protein n=1 Tax=Actinoplanes sp. NPDC051851 TaxID=3154753 RepID=UPI0034138289